MAPPNPVWGWPWFSPSQTKFETATRRHALCSSFDSAQDEVRGALDQVLCSRDLQIARVSVGESEDSTTTTKTRVEPVVRPMLTAPSLFGTPPRGSAAGGFFGWVAPSNPVWGLQAQSCFSRFAVINHFLELRALSGAQGLLTYGCRNLASQTLRVRGFDLQEPSRYKNRHARIA